MKKVLKTILLILVAFFLLSMVLGFLRNCTDKDEEETVKTEKEITTVSLADSGYNDLDVKTYVGATPGAELRFVGDGKGTLRASDDGTLTVKNMTIIDGTSDAGMGIYESYLRFGGKLYFENCTFQNSICLTTEASAEFVNCKFVSNQSRYYSVWVADGSASFEGCEFVGFRGLKVNEYNATYQIDKLSETLEDVISINVVNCRFEVTEKPGVSLGGFTTPENTTVSIKDSVFVGCEVYETGDVFEITFSESGNVVE